MNLCRYHFNKNIPDFNSLQNNQGSAEIAKIEKFLHKMK